MNEEEKLSAEKDQLNLLINKGATFNVERTVYKKPSLFEKRIPIKETLTFKIEEPTLSTLDRISAEQIEMAIDENVMASADGLSASKKLANKHSRRFAKIVALAVMGQDYVKSLPDGARIRYTTDDKRLDELTDLFFHNVKPTMLRQLVELINAVSNLGDFCYSIRLMSGERTTIPIRIEEDKEV